MVPGEQVAHLVGLIGPYIWYLSEPAATVKFMVRNRFENLDEIKQNRLLDCAAEEFAERGYDAASLNKILEKSGMSKSSLYYYFEDKADLFSSLTERSLAFLMKEIGGLDPSALHADNFWSELEERVRRALAISNENTWYVKLGRMVLRLRGQPKGIEKTSRLYGAARAFVETVLLRGQELGVVRTDLPQSLMVDCAMGLGEAVDGWMLTHWEEMTAEERLAMVSTNFSLFRRLLEKTGGP